MMRGALSNKSFCLEIIENDDTINSRICYIFMQGSIPYANTILLNSWVAKHDDGAKYFQRDINFLLGFFCVNFAEAPEFTKYNPYEKKTCGYLRENCTELQLT